MSNRNLNRKVKSKKENLPRRFKDGNPVAADSGEKRNDAYSCPPNDWRWYASNEQLLKDSASYSYAYPLGNIMDYGTYGADANRQSLPGIMRIMWAPTFGYSDNMNSPINVAARSVYTIVRRANSGARNYDPADLMIYLCAMDSAYFMLEHFKRVYGVCNTYSQTNKFYPKAVVQALGVDFDDIQANLADFRAFINVCAVKLNSLAIPATMSYMAKHMWMNSGLFLDTDVQKAQTYMFVPRTYFRFQLDSDGAGMLKCEPATSLVLGNAKLSTIKNLMNSIIDPLVVDEDFGTMSGDILKAYGEGKCVRISGITDTYTVIPKYEETALDQIQNLTLVGDMNSEDCDLHQDANKKYLVYTPTWLIRRSDASGDTRYPGRNAYFTKRFVTFTHDRVEPKDTMEATRMCNIASSWEAIGNYYDKLTYRTLGSEVACFVNTYIFSKASGSVELHKHADLYLSNPYVVDLTSGISETTMNNVANMFSSLNTQLSDLMKFNRHMPVSMTAGIHWTAEGESQWSFDGFNGYAYDVNYYTIVEAQDLEQMSEVALMSEFDLVQFGTKDVM